MCFINIALFSYLSYQTSRLGTIMLWTFQKCVPFFSSFLSQLQTENSEAVENYNKYDKFVKKWWKIAEKPGEFCQKYGKIVFMLTLLLVDITFWLTLYFVWHYFFVDITFWLTLLYGWHFLWLILLFGWHHFCVDITFLLTLLFGWHYFLDDITF